MDKFFSIIVTVLLSLGATIGVLFAQLSSFDNRIKEERQQQQEYQEKFDNLTKQIELTNKIILCQNDISFEKAQSPVNQARVDALELQLAELIRQLSELRGGGNSGG